MPEQPLFVHRLGLLLLQLLQISFYEAVALWSFGTAYWRMVWYGKWV